MNADYVEKIIRNIDEEFYTYKCILVDGTWGIGKSYMVRKALEDKKDRTCFVSLFGMDNVQQIYHEILFQLLLRSADGGKMIRWLKDATKVFGNFSYGAKNINTVLESRFSELDALVALSQKFETKHVVVIDDLERYKESLKLREIFGVIENLKQCHDIYVIAVANLNELENKKEFDKYNEKVIDRIFQITEYSSQIKWSNLNVEPSFAVRFFQKHKTANLRTIQKAQRFFTDVSGYCDGIKDERFRDEIRQICFAVVIEDTDKLYYIDPQNRDNSSKENRIQNIMEEQENKIESRISNYTQHLKSSRDFITVIYGYYKNQIALTREEIIVQYKLYQSSGEKANYYKSDKELEYYLDSWKSGLENISNSPILTKTAGEYDYWFVFLDRNDTELICVYKEKIIELLIKEVQEQEYEPTFTPFVELNSILEKVRDNGKFSSFADIVVTSFAYHFTQKMHDDYPDAASLMSKGHAYDLKSNVFDRLSMIFYDEKPNDGHEYIRIFGRDGSNRTLKYIRKEYVNKVSNLDKYKLLISKADGASGHIGKPIPARIIGKAEIVEPWVGSTETFLGIGRFETRNEAENCLKYIKTKFARTMLGVLKVTQDITPTKWKYVPLQDFTAHSDIDWSKSVAEIDQQLYRKYDLTADEIEFIETHVKEMA